MKQSNVSHDKIILEPEGNDVVAIKIAGVEDFKLGVVICNKQSPRFRSGL